MTFRAVSRRVPLQCRFRRSTEVVVTSAVQLFHRRGSFVFVEIVRRRRGLLLLLGLVSQGHRCCRSSRITCALCSVTLSDFITCTFPQRLFLRRRRCCRWFSTFLLIRFKDSRWFLCLPELSQLPTFRRRRRVAAATNATIPKLFQTLNTFKSVRRFRVCFPFADLRLFWSGDRRRFFNSR